MIFRSTIARILNFIRHDEEGQGLAEYALILALIAVISIIALLYLGTQVSDKLSTIGGTLQSVAP
jgi:pilus assembly protein Flp/PilA